MLGTPDLAQPILAFWLKGVAHLESVVSGDSLGARMGGCRIPPLTPACPAQVPCCAMIPVLDISTQESQMSRREAMASGAFCLGVWKKVL